MFGKLYMSSRHVFQILFVCDIQLMFRKKPCFSRLHIKINICLVYMKWDIDPQFFFFSSKNAFFRNVCPQFWATFRQDFITVPSKRDVSMVEFSYLRILAEFSWKVISQSWRNPTTDPLISSSNHELIQSLINHVSIHLISLLNTTE